MTITYRIATILNALLLLVLLAGIGLFVSFMNVYGAFLASVTTLIAVGIFRNNSWSYFAAAAWGLAAYQLAKQGYEFQSIKHYAMLLGFLVIPIALFLHEILGKRNKNAAPKSVIKDSDDREMPQ